MREMRYSITTSYHSREEFYDAIANDEPFCFHRHWRNEQEELGIREHHTECEKYAEHRTGRTTKSRRSKSTATTKEKASSNN